MVNTFADAKRSWIQLGAMQEGQTPMPEAVVRLRLRSIMTSSIRSVIHREFQELETYCRQYSSVPTCLLLANMLTSISETCIDLVSDPPDKMQIRTWTMRGGPNLQSQ